MELGKNAYMLEISVEALEDSGLVNNNKGWRMFKMDKWKIILHTVAVIREFQMQFSAPSNNSIFIGGSILSMAR